MAVGSDIRTRSAPPASDPARDGDERVVPSEDEEPKAIGPRIETMASPAARTG